jgi:hypothetical protein
MNLQEHIRRVLREELINESLFFKRRVDIDEVKKIIPKYAQQVFYETDSYEQFKYNLVLDVVEHIMWSEYEMAYYNLPEQQEIDYVTAVSDILEDDIKGLYNYYKK